MRENELDLGISIGASWGWVLCCVLEKCSGESCSSCHILPAFEMKGEGIDKASHALLI